MSLLAGLAVASVSSRADSPLPPIDSYLTTLIDKSVIAGAVTGLDELGNLKFEYTGKIYSVETNRKSGQLKELDDAIGSIAGTAAFPMEFANIALGLKAYMDGAVPPPDMSQMPPVINWTCNTCTMVVNGTTYRSIVDMQGMFPDASIQAMRMQGRAFTGLGPVEMGKLSAQSMSVRMAGCSAVVGVSGPNAGMVGTLCLNGTFTFDLSGIVYSMVGGVPVADMMNSQIRGTGTSNCVTVLHTPMAMPQ
jgi:hypothetical protein